MNVKYFISANLKEKQVTLIFSSGTELTFVKENIDSNFKYDNPFIELIEKRYQLQSLNQSRFSNSRTRH